MNRLIWWVGEPWRWTWRTWLLIAVVAALVGFGWWAYTNHQQYLDDARDTMYRTCIQRETGYGMLGTDALVKATEKCNKEVPPR